MDLATIVGGALLAVLIQAAFCFTAPGEDDARKNQRSNRPNPPPTLGFGLIGVRVDQLEQAVRNKDRDLGAGMSGYLLPFEIISIHLVVVLVGAAYLARATARSRREISHQSDDKSP